MEHVIVDYIKVLEEKVNKQSNLVQQYTSDMYSLINELYKQDELLAITMFISLSQLASTSKKIGGHHENTDNQF